MVAKAYVLIETEVGKTNEVVRDIRRLKGIVLVRSVTGPYDVIAIMEGKNTIEVGELVTTKIHPIDGISRTVICLAIRNY